MESAVNRDSDSILRSITEEQPSTAAHSMFSPGEGSQQSLNNGKCIAAMVNYANASCSHVVWSYGQIVMIAMIVSMV